MIAQARIDAAHGVTAQRVGGKRGFGLFEHERRIALAPDHRIELGELRAIFALRVKRDRALDARDA